MNAPQTIPITENPPIEIARLLETPTKLSDEQSGIRDTYYGSITLANDKEQNCYIKNIDPNEVYTEVLCSFLCSAIGIPTPKPYLVLLDGQATIGQYKIGDNPILYATEDADRPSFKMYNENKDLIYSWLIDWKHTPKGAVLDEQIANQDRNQGNVLIGGKGDFCLIDHGMAFDPSTFADKSQVKNSLADILSNKPNPLKSITSALPMLAEVNFNDLVRRSLWEHYADESHVLRIESFYNQRLNHIRDIFDFRFCESNNMSLPI
jgi:hypothetical protein